ncbi:NmrA family NAD(P)-binding protein [Nocardia sp. AG03]|uniref:NmrA family NAD(P)-binding protein n=1 Tax=Nocardia sp. AG03 TaxID=3025312 RepID=UPI0024188F80|nr:NmrA family NAD(P)-binding protein [Nocardia sp. AG03]
MISELPVLVTGATGQQGGATARRLLADGHPVRALVRDADSDGARALATAGAELAVGTFEDAAALRAAVTGTRAVFLVPVATYTGDGWDITDEARHGIAVVEAAVAAGVEQIVFTGVASAGDPKSWGMQGKVRIEESVAASGLRYTLLRPVRFMENYLLQGSPVDGVRPGGEHYHLFPADRPLQMIAVDDIAAIAALAFADPDGWHGRTLDLAGEAITPVDAATVIGRATGRPVHYREATEAEADAIGPQLGNVWRLSRQTGGWHADIPALRALYPGLTSLSDWLARGAAERIRHRIDAVPAH